MTGSDAFAIYQNLLDTLSEAIMKGDKATALARVKLPYFRRTLSNDIVVETQEDLVNDLLTFGDALKGQGADTLVRLALKAEFLSENYIAGQHVTHTLRGANAVMESYANRMVLIRDKGVWKMLEMESMLSNLRWPMHVSRVHQDAANKIPPPSPENDVRKLAIDPLTLYQNFIDELSQANNKNDFDLFYSHLKLPYSSHTEVADTVVSSLSEVREFFDMIGDTLEAKSCDHIMRRAKDAEFISSDLICGYHVAEFYAQDVCLFGPIKSRMVLQRKGTNWYLKSVTHSLQNSKFPYTVPQPSDALVTLRTIQERTRT